MQADQILPGQPVRLNINSFLSRLTLTLNPSCCKPVRTTTLSFTLSGFLLILYCSEEIARRGIIVYLEYQVVCPIVGIGPPTPSPASECVSPLGLNILLRVRG
jgi:hypothetical protein